MKSFEVKFIVFGKPLKMTVIAENPEAARRAVIAEIITKTHFASTEEKKTLSNSEEVEQLFGSIFKTK